MYLISRIKINYQSEAWIMNDNLIGSGTFQFLSSLKLVKAEIVNSLERATNELDLYSEQNDTEHLRSFLEEVQQIRGTFKMLDFRAGERLCEELAETGRIVRNQDISESTLNAFMLAIVFLKRYLDFVSHNESVAPSLLIPTINLVRSERGDKPLPEAYFFTANLRPKYQPLAAIPNVANIPYRRARQMYQLGLLGLLRGQGRRGPVQVMLRAINRFEQLSRGNSAWLFWYVVSGALEALAQPEFEMTPQRLTLLRFLDLQVRRVQELEGKVAADKVPDWLLKEFLYLVAIAQPDSELLKAQQALFKVDNEIKEKLLSQTRSKMRGPDQEALDSLSKALQEEIQSVKDQVDLFERTEVTEQNLKDLLDSLAKIADTLSISNLTTTAERTSSLMQHIAKIGIAGIPNGLVYIADEVIKVEQDMRALKHGGLDKTAIVDPVSLNEARISIISESMSALTLIKRSIGSFLDSNNDKMHIKNVSKGLTDVAGAMVFLEKEAVTKMLFALDVFIRKQVLESVTIPSQVKMEAFADTISAIEYYLDTIDSQGKGADEALKLAANSIVQLQR